MVADRAECREAYLPKLPATPGLTPGDCQALAIGPMSRSSQQDTLIGR